MVGSWRITAVAGVMAGISLLTAPPILGDGAGLATLRGRDAAKAIEASTNDVLTYHALIIGINHYQVPVPVGWPTLESARPDAAELADLLEDKYGFKVKRLFDDEATLKAIIQALDELADYSMNDAVLIYFAGHGAYNDKMSMGFWIPSDARKVRGGKQAIEDWLWNSSLTSMLEASAARHILVVTDSCFGGAMYRGENVPELMDTAYYHQAIQRPSRYRISSGDLEPILDGGGRHTVFAQSLINYLKAPPKPVFSASELGDRIARSVVTKTHQKFCMGRIDSPADADGQFVFQSEGASLGPVPTGMLAQTDSNTRGAAEAGTEDDVAGAVTRRPQQTVAEAALLGAQGATKSAAHLLAQVADAGGLDPRLVEAVKAYADSHRRQEQREELRELIRFVGALPPPTTRAGHETLEVRPRILTSLGVASEFGGPEAAQKALMLDLLLRQSLKAAGGTLLVDRDSLADVLQEKGLARSDLTDANMQSETGRLLPASLMLVARLLPYGAGYRLFTQVVDVETSQDIPGASCLEQFDKDADELAIADKIARHITTELARQRPLMAAVTDWNEASIQAAIGYKHGARQAMRFQLTNHPDRFGQGTELAQDAPFLAEIESLEAFTSELRLVSPRQLPARHPKGWSIVEVPNGEN